MPTIGSDKREYIEAAFPGQIVVHDTATGTEVLVNEECFEPFHVSLARTGFFRGTPREALHEALLGLVMRETLLADIKNNDVLVVVTLNDAGQLSTGAFDCGYVASSTRVRDLPEQGITTELSPLVRIQVDQIVTGVNSKLQERLYQFGNARPGQEQIAESTTSAVNDLVAWLCRQSDTVSATVSNDGMLSIATVFPNDVRLYVEIERDGSIGAAVTRERRYARDISGNTVADLAPEVILAAVDSI